MKGLFVNTAKTVSVDKNKLSQFGKILGLATAGMIGVVIVGLAIINWFYTDKAWWGVIIGDVSVAGMTQDEMQTVLDSRLNNYIASEWPNKVYFEANQWLIEYDPNLFKFDLDVAIKTALNEGKTGSMLERLRASVELWQHGKRIPLPVTIQEKFKNDLSASISAQIDIDEVMPDLEIIDSASGSGVIIREGMDGKMFEKENFWSDYSTAMAYFDRLPTQLPIEVKSSRLSPEQEHQALARGNALLGKKLVLTFPENENDNQWELDDKALVEWLGLLTPYDQQAIENYLNEVGKAIGRPAQNAKFEFNKELNKVEEFVPAKDGLELNVELTLNTLLTQLEELQHLAQVEPVELVVNKTEPDITTAEVNNLGITELLGRGQSTYLGSIPGRVHNIALAASRISGTLVPPGEEFSYNRSVGDISTTTGFQTAYVIKDGRTELGDGGGVCQDSTTIFRAALDAGLPITERRGHSYRVGYYEQNAKPGLDATVYAPSTDFKFLNDTPSHVLVQVEADSAQKSLLVEIYGTSDGRVANIINHTVWDITPPLPDEYIDDPTLPQGQVKQVDWKAGGAKAKFDYVVKKGEEILYEKTFTTTYKPWSAKFLRGSGS
jgi:vancomycin resistance protein YoaR